MLEIKTGKTEVGYNEETSEFRYAYEGPKYVLEHSLLSLSKWEAKYKKPFLTPKENKTQEELLDYFTMMVVEGDPDTLLTNITEENLIMIGEYVSKDNQSATFFSDLDTKKPSREVITAEIIYYMLFSNRISKECETWNLNRLLILIKVFSEKAKESDPNKKKMSNQDLIERNKRINAARKNKLQSRG